MTADAREAGSGDVLGVRNILLITTDQQKATTIGAYGDVMGATPNIDALAARGTRYSSARTANPFCQPARASILTGQYPSSHGVVRNGIDLPHEAEHDSVAAALRDVGYATAYFGKAHFSSNFPDFPTGRIESVADQAALAADWTGPYFGFDYVQLTSDVHNIRTAPLVGQWVWGFGPPPFGLHYAQHLFRDGFEAGVERLRLLQPEAAGRTWDHTQCWPSQLAEEDHHTTWVADRAIDWLTSTSGPLFGWVSFPDPHHAFDPPAPWSTRFAPEDMRAVLPAFDPSEFVGKPAHHEAWTQGFRGTPMEWANPGWARMSTDEQLRILAAYWGMVAQLDHAIGRILAALEATGKADDTLVIVTTDHGDFMGEHGMILKGPLHYESLVRVPLIVAGPGVEAGRVVDAPVSTVDLAPTILQAARINVIGGRLDGTPLDDPSHEVALTEDDITEIWQLRTLRTVRYRITQDHMIEGNGELYDLDDDPGELRNRWDDPALAAVKDELLTALHDRTVLTPRRILKQVCAAG